MPPVCQNEWIMRILHSAVAFTLAALTVVPHMAGADLAPGGVLRVTFLQTNPVHGKVDPATGAISGPVQDLTVALAARLKIPFKIIPAASIRAAMDNVKNDVADVGLLAYDETRAAEVDFSQPWALAMNSYLVRAESPFKIAADVDRAGVRIAAGKGDAGDLYLARNLKNAKLNSIQGLDQEQGYRMLMASETEAYAANRSRLASVAARPGVRIVADDFSGVEQCLVVAQGDPLRVAALNEFIDFARSSGLIQGMIDKAKLIGVRVAPAKAR